MRLPWLWVIPTPGKGLWALGGLDDPMSSRTQCWAKCLLGVGTKGQADRTPVGCM